jgi:hypothetical protein
MDTIVIMTIAVLGKTEIEVKIFISQSVTLVILHG